MFLLDEEANWVTRRGQCTVRDGKASGHRIANLPWPKTISLRLCARRSPRPATGLGFAGQEDQAGEFSHRGEPA